MNTDLVVLGAGPAGMAAAWRAARSGLSVTVLEETSLIGGLAASVDVGGVRADFGSHRLSPTTRPDILADVAVLLGEDLQTRLRHGRLLVRGRWLRYPLRPWDAARVLPPGMLSRVAADAVAAPLRRLASPRAQTYASVLRASLGPTLYGALYEPFAVKLWGLPGERLSGRQARARVVADTPGKVVRRTMRGTRNATSRTYLYPRRGFGQITEALAEAAQSCGVRIVTGVQPERLAFTASRATVSARDGSEYTAQRIFSTLPVPGLVRLVSPGAPVAVVEAASRLRFRAVIVLHLVHSGGRWSPYDAHYIPGDGTRISRISEPTNYRDNPADPKDRTVICVEMPCTVADAVWTLSDEAIASQVLERLAILGLPPVNPIEMAVHRLRNVYPVYAAGFESDLRVLDSWLSSVPRLTSFGRVGLFAHDSTHHALEEAYAAADAFAGGRWDEPAWRAARVRFAEHVVED